MIKEIRLRNFFSFKEETIVHLNSGVNILLGINGSGKTSFINAFRLLYEGVCGDGFENLFQKEWGGYVNVSNAVADNTAKSIDLILALGPTLGEDYTEVSIQERCLLLHLYQAAG